MTFLHAAEELGVTYGLLRNLAYDGQVPTVRVGRHLRIPREALDQIRSRLP